MQGERKITDPNAPWQEQVVLYNLKEDMAETTNLAQQDPATVAEIAKLAIEAFAAGRTTAGPTRPNSCNEPQIDLLKKLVVLIDEHK